MSLVCFLIYCTSSASVAYTGLGGLSQYNTIIFDEFHSEGGIIEGPLALKGSLFIASGGGAVCEIATAARTPDIFSSRIGHVLAPEDEAHPSLILSGNQSSFNSENLKVVSTSTQSAVIATLVDNALVVDTIGHQTVSLSNESLNNFFNSIKSKTNKTITLAKLFERSVTIENADFGIGYSISDPTLLLTTININDTLNFSQINIPKMQDELLLVFSEAKTISFENGSLMYDEFNDYTYPTPLLSSSGELLDQLSSKIIWVFPNATIVNSTNYDIIGSVLAPNAIFTGIGGSVNGQLIVKSLFQTSSFRINNYRFDWTTFNNLEVPIIDLPEDPEEEIIDEDDPDPIDDIGPIEDPDSLVETLELQLITTPLNTVPVLSTPSNNVTPLLPTFKVDKTKVLEIQKPFKPPFNRNDNYYWVDNNNNSLIEEGEFVSYTLNATKQNFIFKWIDKNTNGLLETNEITIEELIVPANVSTLPNTGEIPDVFFFVISFFFIIGGICFYPKQLSVGK